MYHSPLSRPDLSIDTSHRERQTASAARSWAGPSNPSSSLVHRVTLTRGLRFEHVCTTPYSFPCTASAGAHVESRIVCVPVKSSPGECSTRSKSLERLNGRATSFLFKTTYSSMSSQLYVKKTSPVAGVDQLTKVLIRPTVLKSVPSSSLSTLQRSGCHLYHRKSHAKNRRTWRHSVRSDTKTNTIMPLLPIRIGVRVQI